jgi:hypothetical protein
VRVTDVVLQVAVLGCKAGIAVLLVTAGGAKLAGLRGFASSVRLFVPAGVAHWVRAGWLAGGIAVGEVGLGTVSLGMPRAGWLNPVVLAVCLGFLAVSSVGYARFLGRPCRCFGALSRREFGATGVLRACLLVLAALVTLVRVPATADQVGVLGSLGLAAAAVLVAGVAFGAAAAAVRVDAGRVGASSAGWT